MATTEPRPRAFLQDRPIDPQKAARVGQSRKEWSGRCADTVQSSLEDNHALQTLAALCLHVLCVFNVVSSYHVYAINYPVSL